MLNTVIKIPLLLIFFLSWENADCSSLIPKVQKHKRKMRRVSIFHGVPCSKSNFFVTSYRREKLALKKFGNKRNTLITYSKESDEMMEEEIEQLIKDIEEGKMGKESLQLFKDIEQQKMLQEEKEKEEEKRLREKNKIKANFHNIDEVVNCTDDVVKNSVKDMFCNVSENEESKNINGNNTKAEKEKEIEKEKTLINKIGKLYDEIEEKEDSTSPEEQFDILKIKKQINLMKDDVSEMPIKNAAKTILKKLLLYSFLFSHYAKRKGMLHQPFEEISLNHGKHIHWRESPHHIECYIPVPFGTRNEDVFFYLQTDHIKLEIIEQKKMVPLINHKLYGKISYADSYWVLTKDFKENEQHIHLVAPKMGTSRLMWEKLISD